MFGLTGFAARIVLALLYGVGTFIVLFIIGLIVTQIDPNSGVGDFIDRWCAIVGLLVGIYVFLTGRKPAA